MCVAVWYLAVEEVASQYSRRSHRSIDTMVLEIGLVISHLWTIANAPCQYIQEDAYRVSAFDKGRSVLMIPNCEHGR